MTAWRSSFREANMLYFIPIYRIKEIIKYKYLIVEN
jgi:hypothetical protein